MPSPSECNFGFSQSDEKGASTSLRDACRHCGKTKFWHDEQERLKKQPSYDQALEFMKRAKLGGYEQDPAFEFARVVLTRYIEWRKNQSV